jgi:hypothetical protein
MGFLIRANVFFRHEATSHFPGFRFAPIGAVSTMDYFILLCDTIACIKRPRYTSLNEDEAGVLNEDEAGISLDNFNSALIQKGLSE